jgi:xanthine dehydrogenase iron-sulfur cluster and FAD-binding subunit A
VDVQARGGAAHVEIGVDDCQPRQIMAAVALVNDVKAQGRAVTDDDLDTLRNVCRCGTYPRIRDAIKAGAANMPALTVHKVKAKSRKTNKHSKHKHKVA